MISSSVLISICPFLLIIFLYFLYKWIVLPKVYFSNRNIPHAESFPLLELLKCLFFRSNGFSIRLLKQYAKHKDSKFFGLYAMRPVFIIKDLDLIREILVENFDHFSNHRKIANSDPMLMEMIQFMRNEKWESMRETLMPAFTAEKIRLMFYLIEEYCEIMIKHLNEKLNPKESLEIDMKNIFTRFSNDVIASIVFGIKVDSLSKPDNELFRKSSEAVKFSKKTFLLLFIFKIFHKLVPNFRIKILNQPFTNYFKTLVLDTIKYRSENDIRRFDMIQLLMESSKDYYQKSPEGKDTKFFSIANKNANGHPRKQYNWSDNQIVSQCLAIFISGFTYTSNLLSYTTLELSRHSNIQDRLQKEIDQIRDQLNGRSVTYEALNSMKYLDMILCEALRKLPGGVIIDRVCTKPYTIADDSTGLSIDLKPGDAVWIPVQALHFDPEYFPDPDKFDPERFNDENRGFIKPYSYIPFSAGPRSCFCSKFSLMQCKAALFNLLSKYRFEALTSTKPDQFYHTAITSIFNHSTNYRIRLTLRN